MDGEEISVESIEVKEEEVVGHDKRFGLDKEKTRTIIVESVEVKEVKEEQVVGRDERFGLDKGETHTISVESIEVKEEEVVGRDERFGLDKGETLTTSMVSIEVNEEEVVGRDERFGLDKGETLTTSVVSIEVKEEEVVGRDERFGLDKGETLTTSVVSVEVNEEEVVGRDERFGLGGGLSEMDFLSRQRYLENSSLPDAVSHTVSMATQPIEPKVSSSHELHNFVKNQRKIITTFRAQPWPMQVKLAALRSYKKNLHKHVPNLNRIDTFRDSSSLAFTKAKRLWHTATRTLTVWNSIIKSIEGNFGTSVASFFNFLRWMCALNLVLTVFVACFIVLPQLLVGHGLDVPDSIRGNISALSIIIDGRGYAFEYSVLFYGYYDSGQNESYHAPPANEHPYIGELIYYKLPLAYLLVSVGLFVISGFAILKSMAKKLKLLKRDNVGEHFLFTWKVFASWDFAITSHDLAAENRKKIGIALKETIAEAMKKEHSGIKNNVLRWITRGFTNSALLIILGASCYAIFVVVKNAESVDQTIDILATVGQGWNGLNQLILAFQVPLVIVARNLIIPLLFKLAQLVEGLHPRAALKMMLLRMFVLYFSGLYVLLVSLFTLSNICEAGSHCCWETVVGQELYKLTVVNFLTDIVFIVIQEGGRWLFSTRLFIPCSKLNKLYHDWIGLCEFELASNVLSLVYGQALILFGVLFCPVLVGIGFARNVITFYVRAGALRFFNKPPDTLFRIASTLNFYMGLLLFTVFTCALLVIYVVVELIPSNNCGPFRGLPNMLHVVVNEISTWPTALQTIIGYCQRPTVLVPIIALLCIGVYYFAGRLSALKEANKDLKLQLRVELNDAREKLKRYVVGSTKSRTVMAGESGSLEETELDHSSTDD